MEETVIHEGVDPRVVGESESCPKVVLEHEEKVDEGDRGADMVMKTSRAGIGTANQSISTRLGFASNLDQHAILRDRIELLLQGPVPRSTVICPARLRAFNSGGGVVQECCATRDMVLV